MRQKRFSKIKIFCVPNRSDTTYALQNAVLLPHLSLTISQPGSAPRARPSLQVSHHSLFPVYSPVTPTYLVFLFSLMTLDTFELSTIFFLPKMSPFFPLECVDVIVWGPDGESPAFLMKLSLVPPPHQNKSFPPLISTGCLTLSQHLQYLWASVSSTSSWLLWGKIFCHVYQTCLPSVWQSGNEKHLLTTKYITQFLSYLCPPITLLSWRWLSI